MVLRLAGLQETEPARIRRITTMQVPVRWLEMTRSGSIMGRIPPVTS
jgi:hypothetical protein